MSGGWVNVLLYVSVGVKWLVVVWMGGGVLGVWMRVSVGRCRFGGCMDEFVSTWVVVEWMCR